MTDETSLFKNPNAPTPFAHRYPQISSLELDIKTRIERMFISKLKPAEEHFYQFSTSIRKEFFYDLTSCSLISCYLFKAQIIFEYIFKNYRLTSYATEDKDFLKKCPDEFLRAEANIRKAIYLFRKHKKSVENTEEKEI